MKRSVMAAWLVLAVSGVTACGEDASQEKYIPLFDGKSLDGWEKVGKDSSV